MVYLSEDDDQDVWATTRKNIEIYIDDMVVKSKLESDHIDDLENIFEILKRHNL